MKRRISRASRNSPSRMATRTRSLHLLRHSAHIHHYQSAATGGRGVDNVDLEHEPATVDLLLVGRRDQAGDFQSIQTMGSLSALSIGIVHWLSRGIPLRKCHQGRTKSCERRSDHCSPMQFDVTCLFGLRHTIETLMVYGCGATLASAVFPLIVKRISLMVGATRTTYAECNVDELQTSASFTTLLHSGTMILLFFTRTQRTVYLSPLILKLILFFAYGIVIGLWSTIAICKDAESPTDVPIFCCLFRLDSLCQSAQFSSASIFAQSLAIRSLGRIIAYACSLLLCQWLLFYVNAICLLLILAFVGVCYCCCCREKKQ